ncbi:MAG TPA: exodeoxyribonuclease III [Rudaea sp.]|jgi:exodeoxyribonuclease-3
MKIASWNVNSLNVRLPHLGTWLGDATPDVVALQETKTEDAKFPADALAALGYQSVFSGQKTYNGVALLTREPVRDVVTDIPGLEDHQRRILAATVGDRGSDPTQVLRIVNLYVVNGQSVGSEKYAYKLDWLARMHDYLAAELQRFPQMIVLGDFNIAPEDRDVHDPTLWHEQVLCSTPERAALARLTALGLHDSFRLFEPAGGHYSWWDYRQGAFRRNLGVRIDLVLVSDTLRSRCRAASIDRVTRSWERPSDHVPVTVEIA